MSSDYNSSYLGACRKDIPYPNVSHESVPSMMDNLVYALYGTIQKSVVNKRVVWNIPCDPNNTTQVKNVPRYDSEGLLCYIIRVFDYYINQVSAVTLDGVQTLTNKTLVSPTITGTGAIAGTFTGNITGSVTGSVTGNVTGNVTGSSGSCTGNAATANSATTATTATNIAGGGPNYIPYQTANNVTGFISSGTAKQVLLVPAAGGAPIFSDTTGTNGITCQKSLYLSGGDAGKIPYQTAAGLTDFTAAGTTGQALVSGGTGSPIWVDSVTTSTNIAAGAANQIPYQTGAGATSFISAGSALQVLLVPAAGGAPVFSGTTGTNGITCQKALYLSSGSSGALPIQTASGQTAFAPIGPTGQKVISGQSFVGTGTISTTTLTITAVTSGRLYVGSIIAGTGITSGTAISAILTGSGGVFGGVGTYTITNSHTIGTPQSITAIASPVYSTDNIGIATTEAPPAGYVGEVLTYTYASAAITTGQTIEVANGTLFSPAISSGDWALQTTIQFDLTGVSALQNAQFKAKIGTNSSDGNTIGQYAIYNLLSAITTTTYSICLTTPVWHARPSTIQAFATAPAFTLGTMAITAKTTARRMR